MDPLDQPIQAVLPLPSADDLPVPLRSKKIARKGEPIITGIPLHVERLHRGREPVDEERSVVPLGQHRFVGRSEIVPPLEGNPLAA